MIPVMAMLRLPTKESQGRANLAQGALGVGIDMASGKPTHIARKFKIIDEIPGVGKFDKDDSNVGTGLVGAPACGDVVKLQIKVDENDKIIDSKIKVFGCGSAIANTSYTSELIKNMTLDEALKVDSEDIAKATGSNKRLIDIKLFLL